MGVLIPPHSGTSHRTLLRVYFRFARRSWNTDSFTGALRPGWADEVVISDIVLGDVCGSGRKDSRTIFQGPVSLLGTTGTCAQWIITTISERCRVYSL